MDQSQSIRFWKSVLGALLTILTVDVSLVLGAFAALAAGAIPMADTAVMTAAAVRRLTNTMYLFASGVGVLIIPDYQLIVNQY